MANDMITLCHWPGNPAALNQEQSAGLIDALAIQHNSPHIHLVTGNATEGNE